MAAIPFRGAAIATAEISAAPTACGKQHRARINKAAAATAAAGAVKSYTDRSAAHEKVECLASSEEQLAAHKGAGSAANGDPSEPPCAPATLKSYHPVVGIVYSKFPASPKTTAFASPEPKTIARSEAPASHIRFCKMQFIVF